MGDQYRVVFSGRFTSEIDPEAFAGRFSERFGCGLEKARQLAAAGREVVMKRGIDEEQARKYQRALARMGMEVRIEPQEDVRQGAPADLKLAPMEENQEGVAEPAPDPVCPKCGSPDIRDDNCMGCGIIISKYRERQPEQMVHTHHEENPYQAPEADLQQAVDEGEPGDPRSVPAGHGWRWLKEGLGHFRANPLAWILALLAWLAISLVLSIIPLIGTIATTLLSAVVTGGYMIGCQAQERGEAFTVSHLFSGFHQNSGQLLLVGLLYLVGMVVIMFGVFALAGGAAFMMMGDPEAMQDPAAVEAMMSSFYLPLLLAMGLMIPLVMAYWFAPALVALDGLSAIAAMRLSFMGCLKNILPFLLYGLVLFLVMIIAVIPVGLGLLVAIPAMIASVYTGYRDIYYD